MNKHMHAMNLMDSLLCSVFKQNTQLQHIWVREVKPPKGSVAQEGDFVWGCLSIHI